jgi:hypothetical protein
LIFLHVALEERYYLFYSCLIFCEISILYGFVNLWSQQNHFIDWLCILCDQWLYKFFIAYPESDRFVMLDQSSECLTYLFLCWFLCIYEMLMYFCKILKWCLFKCLLINVFFFLNFEDYWKISSDILWFLVKLLFTSFYIHCTFLEKKMWNSFYVCDTSNIVNCLY